VGNENRYSYPEGVGKWEKEFLHRWCRKIRTGMFYLITPTPPPHIYVSKCMYVYVHISLFLPECACTTIIDISPRIFKLIYCCCISIIIVICIVVVYQS
jgi:hypothetical protein